MRVFIKFRSVLKTDGAIYIINLLMNRIFSGFVQQRFKFGPGLLIYRDADLKGLQCAKVGRNFSLGRRSRVEIIRLHNKITFSPRLIIGNDVSMQDDIHIGCVEKITIDDGVLIASKVYISDHNHGNYNGASQDEPSTPPRLRRVVSNPVYIGRNVWVGESVTILPGVSIGEGSIIGANSVVSSNIPANSIAVGSPARIIKKYDVDDKCWFRNG